MCVFIVYIVCLYTFRYAYIYLIVSVLETNVIVNDLLSATTMVFCVYSLHHFVRQQEAERVHRENLVSAPHGGVCVDYM